MVAADSTGVETDRYEGVKPSRRKRCFEAVRRIIQIKQRDLLKERVWEEAKI